MGNTTWACASKAAPALKWASYKIESQFNRSSSILMKCGLLNPYDVGWVLPSTHHTADEDVLGECKCYNAIIGGNKSKHFQLSLILSQWLDGCGVVCLWQLRLVWLCEWHWHCSTEAEHDFLRKWYTTVDWINSMSMSSELCQPAVRVCLKNWLFLDEMCAPRESPHIGMVFWCEVFSPSTRAQQKTRTETALTWMDGWRPSHSCASACSF